MANACLTLSYQYKFAHFSAGRKECTNCGEVEEVLEVVVVDGFLIALLAYTKKASV